jgi:hypothetical protein
MKIVRDTVNAIDGDLVNARFVLKQLNDILLDEDITEDTEYTLREMVENVDLDIQNAMGRLTQLR